MIKFCIEQGTAAEEQMALTGRLTNPAVEPELMLWNYSEPAIILGCSQRRQQAQWQQLQSTRRSGLDVICRRAGGGAVLAGPWMLSATLFIPVSHSLYRLSVPASFELFGRAWLATLAHSESDYAIDTELAHGDQFTPFNQRARMANVDWICFAGLSHGELLDTDGRKLVGLAQIRKKQCVALVSGLLLQPPPWQLLLNGNPQQSTEQSMQRCSTVLQQLIGSVVEKGVRIEPDSLGRLLLRCVFDEMLNNDIHVSIHVSTGAIPNVTPHSISQTF